MPGLGNWLNLQTDDAMRTVTRQMLTRQTLAKIAPRIRVFQSAVFEQPVAI